MRLRLVAPALAAFAARVLVLGSVAPAGATSFLAPPCLRGGVQTDRELAESPWRRPGFVIFEGTAVARRDRDPAEVQRAGPSPLPMPVAWAFTVDRVLHGTVAGPVEVLSQPHGPVDGLVGVSRLPPGAKRPPTPAEGRAWGTDRLAVGARFQVVAWSWPPVPPPPDGSPAPDSRLVAVCAALREGPSSARPPRPAPARFAAAVTLAFLAVAGALGVALVAAGTYLRAKELDLEAREPEVGHRSGGPPPTTAGDP